MDEQPPWSWPRNRRRWLTLGLVSIALVTGLALRFDTQARDAARSFAVRGWQLPLDEGGRAADLTATGSVEREAAETPPPTLHWVPPPDADWQWLPTGLPDLNQPVDVYDLPLATTTPQTVADVHAHGAHAVCRLQVGTVSAADPHVRELDPTLLGKPVPGRAGERYLDIRRLDDLKPFVSDRLDACWAKGFDGVDAAGLDTPFTAGAEGTGFPVGYADALALTTAVAGLGHGRGLAVGLHADPTGSSRVAFVDAAEPITDFAVLERCVTTSPGCGAFARYTEAGKAVLHLEHLQDYRNATVASATAALSRLCPAVARYGYSSIVKDVSGAHPAWRAACP